MKTKLIVNNQHGVTLVELTVVAGLMSILALAMSNMTTNQTKNNKTTEIKMGINTEMGEIKDLLSKNTNCTASFGGKNLSTLPLDVTDIYRSDGTTSVLKKQVGETYENNTVKFSKMEVTSWTEDPGNALLGEMNVRITWEKLGKFYGQQFTTQDIAMRATVNASKVVQDCYTSYGNSSGNDIWQPHDDGIYYDDGTSPIVAIGKNPDSGDSGLLQVDGSASIGRYASSSSESAFAFGGTSSAANAVSIGDYSVASSIGALSFGGSGASNTATTASNQGSIAIGVANTWNPHATSWGYNKGAVASGKGAIAIGSASDDPTLTLWSSVIQKEGAVASGDNTIAIGTRSNAAEDLSIAIGVMSETGGNTATEQGNHPGGVTVGYFSYATDSYTTSVGYRARSGENGTVDDSADNGFSVAVGAESAAKDKGSVAIGGYATAGQGGEDETTTPLEGDYAIAVGYQSYAYDKSSIALGYNAKSGNTTLNTSDPYGIAIGDTALSAADYGIGIGYHAEANSNDSLAIGKNAVAGNIGAIVIGSGASSDSQSAVSIGENASAEDSYGIAIGSGAQANFGTAYDGPISIGKGAVSVGRGIAIGYEATSDGGSYVIGYGTEARGELHIALGGDITNANSDRNIALGYGAEISSAVYESMVLSPVWGETLDVTENRKFIAHFENGFKFCTGDSASPCGQGFQVKADGTTDTLSDRDSKTDLELIDPEEIVDRFLGLDLYWWNYKTARSEEDRHLGPMAQDFKQAFGTFGDEKHINQVDANGVAMAGIKGLAIKNQKLEARVEQLEVENLELKERLDRLEKLMLSK